MTFQPKFVDVNEKQHVTYCIPDWLREDNIKQSSAKPYGRFTPATEIKTEPIALVGFGPSLQDTWLKLYDFKYKMSCSGSHKFLKDRGITPNWHVEVDPRKHKIELIGSNISPDTNFLMASCCHPDVFAHLEKFNANITLWHTYSGESQELIPTIFPRGEWVSTGGSNVGLRAMVLARLLGFQNIHIFGMDGSFRKPDAECRGLRHAAYHPNIAKKYIITKVNGKDFYTSPGFLECAKQTFHEIAMLPDTNITFYGDGLIQEMAKIDKTERKNKVQIAFCVSSIGTNEYIRLNREMHNINAAYGVSALKHIDTIKKMYIKTESKSLLDYGCGKGLLAKNLDFPIWEYDPGIIEKSAPPRAADLVVCIDVLEHIEPDYLNNVLADILRCTKKVCFFTINTAPATKTLPDGRNTHLIQEGKDWWLEKLGKYFDIPEKGVFVRGNEIILVTSPKHKSTKTEGIIISKKEEVTV